jgi:indole-3-glycerol phosphate synthase
MSTPTILKKIVARKHEEVAERSVTTPISVLEQQAKHQLPARGFVKAMQNKLDAGLSAVIAEAKKPRRVKV